MSPRQVPRRLTRSAIDAEPPLVAAPLLFAGAYFAANFLTLLLFAR
jgi:hypothetical protein